MDSGQRVAAPTVSRVNAAAVVLRTADCDEPSAGSDLTAAVTAVTSAGSAVTSADAAVTSADAAVASAGAAVYPLPPSEPTRTRSAFAKTPLFTP